MRALLLLIALSLVLAASPRLDRWQPRKDEITREKVGANLFFYLGVSLFRLNSLAVGWLWVQFDMDTLGAVRNYHRPLALLDLMTLIQPDEFHARGLAAYMRWSHYMGQGQAEVAEIYFNELVEAADRYPEHYRGAYEVATC